MTNFKAYILGAALGIASTLIGVSAAHACPLIDNYEEASRDAAEGNARGYRCEVIRLADETYEAQCDEVAFAEESAACDAFVDATYPPSVDSESRYMAYEACMTIAVHTGAVSVAR